MCITCNDPGPSLGRHLTVSGFFHKPKLSELQGRKLIRSCKISAASMHLKVQGSARGNNPLLSYNLTNFFPIASRNNNLSVRNPNFVETSHIPNTHKSPINCLKKPNQQSTLVAPHGESNVGNFVPDLHRSLPIDPQPKQKIVPKTTAKNCLKAQFEL